MIFLNNFSISRNAAADHRAAMPGCQRQTRRVRACTPECGLSTMLLVARHRCSDCGTSSRLIVKQPLRVSRLGTGVDERIRALVPGHHHVGDEHYDRHRPHCFQPSLINTRDASQT